MNMVRSMLVEKKVPKVFWPEAVKWSVYVLNRCPTVAVQNKTPEEALSDMKPTVEYFRIFGCVAHVYIRNQKRIKLDDKNKKCVLLGVSDESKAYKLFDPVSKKVVISKAQCLKKKKTGIGVEECKLDVLEWEDDKDKSDTE